MNQNKRILLLLIISFVMFSFLVFDVHANGYNDLNYKNIIEKSSQAIMTKYNQTIPHWYKYQKTAETAKGTGTAYLFETRDETFKETMMIDGLEHIKILGQWTYIRQRDGSLVL